MCTLDCKAMRGLIVLNTYYALLFQTQKLVRCSTFKPPIPDLLFVNENFSHLLGRYVLHNDLLCDDGIDEILLVEKWRRGPHVSRKYVTRTLGKINSLPVHAS